MSQIDLSKAPEGATHYLSAVRAEDIAWFKVSGSAVRRWYPHEGTEIYVWSSVSFLPPMSEAIPAIQAPDWSAAPERATHYVYSTRDGIPTYWYVADGHKMRLIGRDDEYMFRLDDVHPTCGLTLVERPPVAPDWGTAPKYATHYAPRVTLDAFHYPPLWLKAEDGSYLKAVWENDWFLRPYGALPKGRAETLIARPMAEPVPFSPDWANAPEDATHHTRDKCEAPWRKVVGGDVFMWHRGAWELIGMPAGLGEYVQRPAVEFVPRDFSGQVIDYGSLPVLILELIDAYQSEADPAHYRVGLVDSLRAKVKELAGSPEWNGEGLPPVGADCVVTPQNTQWGFDNLDTRRVMVHAYAFDHVWLEELLSDGSGGLSFITTRTDKVDFAPYRTPEQVASDKRIEAAQVWLKSIEREYGVEAADKCEDILMDFEKRKKAGAQL